MDERLLSKSHVAFRKKIPLFFRQTNAPSIFIDFLSESLNLSTLIRPIYQSFDFLYPPSNSNRQYTSLYIHILRNRHYHHIQASRHGFCTTFVPPFPKHSTHILSIVMPSFQTIPSIQPSTCPTFLLLASVPTRAEVLHMRLLLTQLCKERQIIAPFSQTLKFSLMLLDTHIIRIQNWLELHDQTT